MLIRLCNVWPTHFLEFSFPTHLFIHSVAAEAVTVTETESHPPKHRRRSGWNSGGRMASAEGGLVPSGTGYGEKCPLPSRLGVLGERHELPQRGPGQIPAKNGFWRILKATERSICTYITKYEGTICISVHNSKFWGTCPLVPPCDLHPCPEV